MEYFQFTADPKEMIRPVPQTYELDLKQFSVSPDQCDDRHRLGSGIHSAVYKVMYKNEWVVIKIYDPAREYEVLEEHESNPVPGIVEEFIRYYFDDLNLPTVLSTIVANYLDLNDARKQQLLIDTKAMKLKHPNFGKLIGYQFQNPLCYVMEFAERGLLFSILKNPRVELPWSLRLWIALQIITGVVEIHSIKMIHGELRSSTVLIREDWSVILLDFGRKKLQYRNEYAWREDEDKPGLLRWGIAPERFEGINTPAVDIFSFGMLMYELLTRTLPWGGGALQEDIIYDLQAGLRPPILPRMKSPKLYQELMKDCWGQNYLERPDSKQVKAKLTSIYEAQLKEEGCNPYSTSTSSLTSPSSEPTDIVDG